VAWIGGYRGPLLLQGLGHSIAGIATVPVPTCCWVRAAAAAASLTKSPHRIILLTEIIRNGFWGATSLRLEAFARFKLLILVGVVLRGHGRVTLTKRLTLRLQSSCLGRKGLTCYRKSEGLPV
jgi:hypothetical protein